MLCACPLVATSASAGQDKLDSELREKAGRSGTTRVIVQFNNEADAEKAIARVTGNRKRDLGRAHVIELSNKQIARLAAEGSVKGLSVDRVAQGAMYRVTGTIQSDVVKAQLGYTGKGVGVAVIDSGLAVHNDLDRRGKSIVAWADFVNGRSLQYDDYGHGTHIGATISGDGFDSAGRHVGVAPDARIIALKALNDRGEGYVSDIIAAIEWTIAHREQYNARVINISASAPVLESYNTDPLCLAVKDAVEAGITVVASAGNMGKHPVSGDQIWGGIGAPGNCPWALTVGASSTMGDRNRANDTMASFSSNGPTRIDITSKPDISAPGTGVVAAIALRSRLYSTKPQLLIDGTTPTAAIGPLREYMALSGTSMSAAVVSGTVALMLQANPALTPNLVKAALQYTAEVNPNYSVLEEGAGFINALDAVTLVKFFRTSKPGDAYPNDPDWSKQVIWGNLRISGGVLTPEASAWDRDQQWGASETPEGGYVVWGDNCANTSCVGAVRSRGGIWGSYADDNIVWGNYWDDNIVWGNYWDDNIVWGNHGADDNIVWGNHSDDNIVWGNYTDDNIVWGNYTDDNIVWGNYADDNDNIVWGNYSDDNIVWGNAEDDNIVWGNADGDNIVWGNYDDDNIVWGNYADDNIVWGN